MKFLKQNVGFLILLVAFGSAVVSSIMLLRSQMAKCEEVRRQREDMRAERNKLVAIKPFPSKENIKLLQKGRDEERELLNEALVPLRKKNLKCDEIEGWEFTKELLAARQFMEDELRKSWVKIPELFQFGFERYEKTPPKKEDTPLLREQLLIIQELVKLCADCHYEIKVIRRAMFEDVERPKRGAGSGASGASDARPAPTGDLPPLISTSGRLEIVDTKGYLYTVMPFELRVMCDTESFRKFLDALYGSEFILLPRVILVTNEKKDKLTAPKAAAPAAGAAGGAAGAAPAARGGRGKAAATPIENLDEEDVKYVIGEERVEVVMLIDWVEFRPAPPMKGRKTQFPGKTETKEKPKSEGAAPDETKAGSSKSKVPKSEAPKADGTKPETAKTEGGKVETPRKDGVRTPRPKAEKAPSEGVGTEVPKAGDSKVPAPKEEKAATEAPK
jgi:hypothetical protein